MLRGYDNGTFPAEYNTENIVNASHAVIIGGVVIYSIHFIDSIAHAVGSRKSNFITLYKYTLIALFISEIPLTNYFDILTLFSFFRDNNVASSVDGNVHNKYRLVISRRNYRSYVTHKCYRSFDSFLFLETGLFLDRNWISFSINSISTIFPLL